MVLSYLVSLGWCQKRSAISCLGFLGMCLLLNLSGISTILTQFFTKQSPLFLVAKPVFSLSSATSSLYNLGVLFNLSVPHFLSHSLELIIMSLL